MNFSAILNVPVCWSNENSLNVTDIGNLLIKPFSFSYEKRIYVGLQHNLKKKGFIDDKIVCIGNEVPIVWDDGDNSVESLSVLRLLFHQNVVSVAVLWRYDAEWQGTIESIDEHQLNDVSESMFSRINITK